jgi:hypothetical protein
MSRLIFASHKNQTATMKLSRLLFALSLSMPALTTSAQVQGDSATVKGATFRMSNSATFWMGANYRKEWNTPVTVPVMNLATEKGGLTPVKRGGGKQTKSLRLEAPDGRQYTIRSIQKFITAKTLPGDLESEAAADLVSDGVSASYPYASLTVQELSKAAGVPYLGVRLVYIGDDPRLGEYREEFKNMLVTFEERAPENLKKVHDTEDVSDKLEKDNDNDVDQRAVIRARLLDMFVMDFDRHEDQWQWGAVDNDRGGKTYFPIPRDRDQAFYINRGILPGYVKKKSMVPQLEGFKPQARNIRFFNLAARNFDRSFLNETTEEDWKAEAEAFVAKMTDDVIDRAVGVQPYAIRDLSGPWIAQTLKARRQFLVAEAIDYYHFLSNMVEVTGSDKKELFEITHNDDGSLLVQVFKIDKEGKTNEKMYERRFDPLYTKEVRLYGMDGEDRFIVHGTADKVKLRMIGGGGEDYFENQGKARGIVYDKRDGNNKIVGDLRNKMSLDTNVNKYDRLGFNYNKFIFPTLAFGYNPDDGLFLGVGLRATTHGFRKSPYKSVHDLSATHALSTKAWRFRYRNELISALGKKTDIVTDIDIRSPNNTTNFFGYGMGSVYDESKPGKFRYYRARYNLIDAYLLLRHRFSEKVHLSLGPTYQYYNMETDDKLNNARFISQTGTGPGKNGLDSATIFSKQKYFGVFGSLLVDTRKNKVLPETGIHWLTTLRYLGGSGDTKFSPTLINSELSFYLRIVRDRLVFANRIGFGVTTGDFNFHQAQYLGNNEHLRGWRKDRFAGESKFFNQAELRWRVANFKTYLFPGALGFVFFVDAGRVWYKDTPDDFAVGYGVGFWISPLRRILITVNYAMSSEDGIPSVTLGWRFPQ